MLDANLFEDPSVEADFCCVICNNVFSEPLIDDCPGKSHTFCKACIERHLANNKNCPLSKLSLTANKLKTDFRTQTAIEKCTMKCPFHQNKCHWKGLNKELQKHLFECTQKFGPFTTPFADFATSGGNFSSFDLSDTIVNKASIRLLSVTVEFSDKFNEGTEFFPALSGFSAKFAYKNNDGVDETVETPRRGRSPPPLNWTTKRHTVVIPEGKKLLAMFFGLGNRFFSTVGFLVEGEKTVKTYGYPQSRKSVIPVVVPRNGIVTGFCGKSGWLIDNFAINYYILPSD